MVDDSAVAVISVAAGAAISVAAVATVIVAAVFNYTAVAIVKRLLHMYLSILLQLQ